MKLQEILEKFQRIAREEIRKSFNKASCIPSTRVTIAVLRSFHIEAEPLAVCMSVANESYIKAVDAGDEPPDDERKRNEWFARTGACSKIIGDYESDGETSRNTCFTGMPFKSENFIGESPVEPGRPMFLAKGEWNGHLVGHLPKHHLLIDASADQVNEPEYDIQLPGVLVTRGTNNRFLHANEPLEGYINGCLVRYEASSNRDYLQSDAWKDKSLTQPAVKAICRAMRRLR